MVTLQVKLLKTYAEKSLGLLPAKKAHPVLIKTRYGIHTFGMKYAIDVLVLDNNDKVVKLAKNLKPNRIFLWNPRYNTVAELPVGAINKYNIKLEDRIRLK